ncbi:MAG: bifunctional folylpolyglutamate synthase/dihydrofolate synthase [Cytophagales bacterium]|nr:bifunctional folylpolyglutamate synthase/dihydrofolate synthase [Cytophagales bacterium]
MNYKQACEFIMSNLPMYQRQGKAAYKKDLGNTLALCRKLNDPHRKFRSVHVAGTNGKGSSSHMLASVLQEAGWKVGLYTSPHLKSFTERIRINGSPVPEEWVASFITQHQKTVLEIAPSFFEITVGMAFQYFAEEKVDIAVIEVGLGGRLDSTNVITPEVCLITNIGEDHQQFLGESLEQIAEEKAGIIKEAVPVVVSQRQAETEAVFKKVAGEKHAPIFFAEDCYQSSFSEDHKSWLVKYKESCVEKSCPAGLKGDYQTFNLNGVLKCLDLLREKGIAWSEEQLIRGLENIVQNSGLKGRWQVLGTSPTMICDTGHNAEGVMLVVSQLSRQPFEKLHIVWGMVNDKDAGKVLELLPKHAHYYFCEADIPRAMSGDELVRQARQASLNGEFEGSVSQAIAKAKKAASAGDLIFVGGSTFVVAEIPGL